MSKNSTKKNNEEEKAPISKVQFAWSSIGLVTGLFLFLGAGNMLGVKIAALMMSGTKALSWYYYDRKLDLVFAIAYLLTVFGWQAAVP